MPKMIDIREFNAAANGPDAMAATAVRFATTGEPVAASDARTLTFVFSDESVDRYGDVIFARGWDLANFNANPIALFGHDAGSVENVIGRAKNVRVEGTRLIGDIEFMGADVNPNAEAVYQMVKGGFLKTVSVGFQPIEWELAKDKSRPQGVNFKKQELMEISIVPIPANPNALIQAKAAGIAIERLGLQVEQPDDAIDTMLAITKMLGTGEAQCRAGKVDGEEIFVFSRKKMPAPFVAKFDDLLDAARARRALETPVNFRALAKSYRKRGLYELSTLCGLVDYADYVCSQVEREATDEGDGSLIPARMRAWVDEGNKIIAAMAQEETSENIQGTQYPANVEDQVDRAVQRALSAFGLVKSGKAISAANEKQLRAAHGHLTAAATCVMSVVEPGEDELDDDGGPDDGDDKAAEDLRRRKAAALKRKQALADA
jgi:HK97 family phage prohead protease